MKIKNLLLTTNKLFNTFTKSYLNTHNTSGGDDMYGVYTISLPQKYEDVIINYTLYHKTDTLLPLLEKADEVADFIGDGVVIPVDGGGKLWIKRGDPFQQVIETEDKQVKGIYMNLIINYLV